MQREMKRVTADDGNSTVVDSITTSKNSPYMNKPKNILPIPVAVIIWYFLGISSTIHEDTSLFDKHIAIDIHSPTTYDWYDILTHIIRIANYR